MHAVYLRIYQCVEDCDDNSWFAALYLNAFSNDQFQVATIDRKFAAYIYLKSANTGRAA